MQSEMMCWRQAEAGPARHLRVGCVIEAAGREVGFNQAEGAHTEACPFWPQCFRCLVNGAWGLADCSQSDHAVAPAGVHAAAVVSRDLQNHW